MTKDDETIDRLRRALAARADTIHPEPHGLDRIEEQLMGRDAHTNGKGRMFAAVAAAAVLVVVALFVASSGDDAETDLATDSSASTTITTAPVEDTATTTTDTTVEPTTSTAATPAPTTTIPVPDRFAVAFPSPTGSQRFDSPSAAARAFATDALGFSELIVGDAISTGAATAIVTVEQREGGPDTVVSLQQMQDGAWYALGASTEDITIDSPAPGASIASPFRTTGQALAFEGTVSVVVLTQDGPTPIGEGFVTGSGSPPAGPYDGAIEFDAPAAPTAGIVVYRIHSEEDGQVSHAAAIRVRLT